jgi:crotonobetainyl-CoA:carnitine CoA-transferase CaiB-like acyl-CoA transferase
MTTSLTSGSPAEPYEPTALRPLLEVLGLADRFHGTATLTGADPVIRSPHRLGEASAAVQLAQGAAASALWTLRTGSVANVSTDVVSALHGLHPSHFVWQNGAYTEVGAEYVAANGAFRTRDDRLVVLCAGPPYMKLLEGYLSLFNCPHTKEAFAGGAAQMTADELEEATAAAGLPGSRIFSADEWAAHPQGALLAATPVVEIEKIGEAPPLELTPDPAFPLSGIRVLDFTHVLAGPRSTQTLAEFGADVLHISSHAHPDTTAQHLGVDLGKYCAYLDLRQAADAARMRQLAAEADVFATSYRSSVNERFGLTPEELAANSERGIVMISVNAYGHEGPWRDRPGFDPNGQAVSGFCASEGGDPHTPGISPVGYLADTTTGYLAAAGAVAALLRRATEGGSWHVKVSLARSAMWVESLGLIDEGQHEDLPSKDTHPYRTERHDTAFGSVESLASPLDFDGLPLPRLNRLVPLGADAPEWPR